jgi:hypothetical protein
VLEILSNIEEKDVIDDANPYTSSNCIEPSSMPKEVSPYMEFVNNLIFELEAQKGLAKGVHDNVQKENMWAQGLMDN